MQHGCPESFELYLCSRTVALDISVPSQEELVRNMKHMTTASAGACMPVEMKRCLVNVCPAFQSHSFLRMQ